MAARAAWRGCVDGVGARRECRGRMAARARGVGAWTGLPPAVSAGEAWPPVRVAWVRRGNRYALLSRFAEAARFFVLKARSAARKTAKPAPLPR